MDTTPFLDYLHEHHATARLAEVLREIVDARRRPAQRRARTRLSPSPSPSPSSVDDRTRARPRRLTDPPDRPRQRLVADPGSSRVRARLLRGFVRHDHERAPTPFRHLETRAPEPADAASSGAARARPPRDPLRIVRRCRAAHRRARPRPAGAPGDRRRGGRARWSTRRAAARGDRPPGRPARARAGRPRAPRRTRVPRSAARSAAHSTARRLSGEPSTPTTIVLTTARPPAVRRARPRPARPRRCRVRRSSATRRRADPRRRSRRASRATEVRSASRS